MNKYQKYINSIEGDLTNKCAEYTLNMLSVFPELIRVRGHYHCHKHGPRPHWWLKTPDGQVVDPTRKQFIYGGEYEEWDESRPEPTGKCPNCGGYCYDNRSVCSDQCSQKYINYLKGFA